MKSWQKKVLQLGLPILLDWVKSLFSKSRLRLAEREDVKIRIKTQLQMIEWYKETDRSHLVKTAENEVKRLKELLCRK